MFVGDRVKHHGQPAGVIVANSYDLAHRAAALVTIQYAKPQKDPSPEVMVTMKDIFAADEEIRRDRVFTTVNEKVEHQIEGIVNLL